MVPLVDLYASGPNFWVSIIRKIQFCFFFWFFIIVFLVVFRWVLVVCIFGGYYCGKKLGKKEKGMQKDSGPGAPGTPGGGRPRRRRGSNEVNFLSFWIQCDFFFLNLVIWVSFDFVQFDCFEGELLSFLPDIPIIAFSISAWLMLFLRFLNDLSFQVVPRIEYWLLLSLERSSLLVMSI